MPTIPSAPAPPVVLPDEPVVGDIETFLETALAALAPEARPPGPGRPRVLPGLCLWAGLLVCVLRGFGSQLQLWRLLTRQGLWRFPRVAITDQALYNRLARAGSAPLAQLFGQISQVLAVRLAPYADSSLAPFAAAVVAIDETTLDQVARLLPALRALPRGDPGLLPGKLAGVFDVRLQQWRHIEYLAYSLQNCKVAARALLAGLPRGTLVLADLGYFGFEWFDDLTDQGFHWLSRLRKKTSYTILHTFYQQEDTFDGIVWLGAHRSDQAAHAVRLVQFRLGAALYQYVTNVRDPYQLPPQQIVRLYARRWDIELAFLLIKRHLGLHLLWASKPVVILQQVWAVLTIAQIFQALRQEVAGRAQVDPYEVSMALLVQDFPAYAERAKDPVAAFVADGRAAGYIRPSSRTRRSAPPLPATICPLPEDLVLQRTPRYARRKCTSLSAATAPPAPPPPVSPTQPHLLE